MSVYPVVLCPVFLLCWLFLQTAAVCQDAAKPADPAAPADGVGSGDPENPFPRAVRVPAGVMDGGAEWFNTSQPLALEDLRGKVVLLDFWTYCCINCMHILPDLKFLEEKYGDQLVVIGVHSAKFDNEKDSQSIRNAMLRYEIEHPVVNDSEMLIWRRFGTRAWPTVALIDPEGNYCGSQSGEGNRELLDGVIGRLIEYHRFKGTLNEKPLAFSQESVRVAETPLRYPGKVSVDTEGNRVFITDSNHNRIVVAGMNGELQSVIGSGVAGRRDGSFQEAEFFRPQGTVLVNGVLYVADTENHLIRAVHLAEGRVSTLAGTGLQGQPGQTLDGGLLEVPLNSPWSIAHSRGTLFIAMAGPHQIWSHVLGSDRVAVHAGSGREDVVNGALAEAAFAQPSELVVDAEGTWLYVVDSEGSAVRRVSTDVAGRAETLAGTSELPRGQSLFAFGYQDGVGDAARFQHPLGVAQHGQTLFVADSYNHRIRRIDLNGNAVTTWQGDGTAGNAIQPLQLSEPGGLAYAGGRLFIADTNNHRIIAVDEATGVSAEFSVVGLTPPETTVRRPLPDLKSAVEVAPVRLAATAELLTVVKLRIPAGWKRNADFPVTWAVFAESEQTVVPKSALAVRQEGEVVGDGSEVQIVIPLSGQPGEASLVLQVTWGYCTSDGKGLCRMASAVWKVPVVLNTDGGESRLELQFPEPDIR
ncbi:MAG: thioredoxin-like domain-containing protein [Planctomyces sp.]